MKEKGMVAIKGSFLLTSSREQKVAHPLAR